MICLILEIIYKTTMSFLISKEIHNCFKNIELLLNLKKARQIKIRYEMLKENKYQINIKNDHKKNYLIFYDLYIILDEDDNKYIFNIVADNNVEKKTIHSFKCTNGKYIEKNLSYKFNENIILRIEHDSDCPINNISIWIGITEI